MKLSLLLLSVLLFCFSSYAFGKPPIKASANGKYANLIQTLHCPKDQKTYGQYKDFGKWGGGSWCGQTAKAGYWVWVNPNWYAWKFEVPPKASLNGKYNALVQIVHCPQDKKRYGNFSNYGYWSGGTWCGQKARAGHWIWVAPQWYVWKTK